VGSGLPLDNFNQYKTVFEKGNREGWFFLNLLVTGDYINWRVARDSRNPQQRQRVKKNLQGPAKMRFFTLDKGFYQYPCLLRDLSYDD